MDIKYNMDVINQDTSDESQLAKQYIEKLISEQSELVQSLIHKLIKNELNDFEKGSLISILIGLNDTKQTIDYE